jgi:hypothetical protein
MRPKQMTAVLIVVLTVLTTASVPVSAAGPAPSAQASTAAPASDGAWYERAWRRLLAAFGVSESGGANWTDPELSAGGACGSRGCTCCHSPIMVPHNVGKSYVHPSPPGSTEDVNGLYLRSARAIGQMNPRERDELRKKIRRALSDSDSVTARALIDASVSKPRSKVN